MTENDNLHNNCDISLSDLRRKTTDTSINSANLPFDNDNMNNGEINESGCNKSEALNNEGGNSDKKDHIDNETDKNVNEISAVVSVNQEQKDHLENETNKGASESNADRNVNQEHKDHLDNETNKGVSESNVVGSVNQEQKDHLENETNKGVRESNVVGSVNQEHKDHLENETNKGVSESNVVGSVNQEQKDHLDNEINKGASKSNADGNVNQEHKDHLDNQNNKDEIVNNANENDNSDKNDHLDNVTKKYVSEISADGNVNQEQKNHLDNQRNKDESESNGNKRVNSDEKDHLDNETNKNESESSADRSVKTLIYHIKENDIEARQNINRAKYEKPKRPTGLPNLRSSCYLNSVLQTLFSCEIFRDEMINYVGLNENLDIKDKDFLFTCQLGHQMFYMVQDGEKLVVENTIELAKHFYHSTAGDDIHKCFLQILTRINSVIKEPESRTAALEDKKLTDEEQFICFRENNNGFIFDIFNGQLSFTIKCVTCGKVFSEKYQLFKSMPLQVSVESSEISLETCIRSYFKNSEIVDSEYKCCDDKIFSASQFTHVPKYLFIYLVRGSYFIGGSKNNAFVKFKRGISIPTTKGDVPYKLISVIDHLGNNESGHYFVKTFCNSRWWLVNDMQVEEIPWKEVPSQNSIGLFFKQGSCDEDDDDYVNDLEELNKKPLKSIIEILYQCVDIRNSLIKYYMNENNQKMFLKMCGEMMHLLQQQKPNKALKLIYILQHMLLESSEDWYGCYIYVLNKINADENRSKHCLDNCMNGETHNENDTLIPSGNDKKYISIGKCLKKIFCESCKITIIEDLYLLRSICMNIKKNGSFTNKIKQYLKKSKIDRECIRCRKEQQLFKLFSIISAPKYLLFYFNSSNLAKNELLFDEGFFLSTEEGDKWYQILLFIHIIRGSYVITYVGEKRNVFENNVRDKEEVSQHFPKFVIGFVAVIAQLKDTENEIKDIEIEASSEDINKILNENTSNSDSKLNEIKDKENEIKNVSIKTSPGSIKFGPEDGQKFAMGAQFPENMTVKPQVIEIPTNTETCSAVIGMILSLSDVRNHLIEFHKSDQIAKINFDARQDISDKDAVFINNLCKMTQSINKNVEKIAGVSSVLKNYIERKSNRFDIYNCYNFFLEKINCFTKPEIETEDSMENMDKSALDNQSQSFINYLFYGEIYIKIFCDNCKIVYDEHYEPIKGLLLDLTMIQNEESITLEECLQWFFSERQINSNDNHECCSDVILKETREFTHSPEYLFICLNRESANGQVDERFVETDDGIIVPVQNQPILYELRCVIDHSTDIILKSFQNTWLSITNQTVSHIHRDVVITSNSCGFLLCKKG